MKLEFTIENPDKNFLDLLFPYRNRQSIKKDLRKHLGNKYYNLSMKNKILVIDYWKAVLNY